MREVPLRILHIVWWNQLGGIILNLTDLMAHIDPTRYQLSVCALSKSNSNIAPILGNTTRIFEIGASSGKDLAGFFRLFRYLLANEFDVIHNHTRTYFCSIVLLLTSKKAIKLFQEHGGLQTPATSRTMKRFYKIFASVYDRFIVVSENTAESMAKIGLPPERIIVVPNAVDSMKFNPHLSREKARLELGLTKDGLIIGTACRFSPEKDLSLFLQIASKVHSVRQDVRFVLVGGGTLEHALRRLVNEYGLNEVVDFLGVRTDMHNVWRSFDIFLFTSIQEAFGRTLLEAQACETPVVAAIPMEGGAIDIIKESPGIIFVKERNPDDLAEISLRLIKNAGERNRIGQFGRKWVIERYDVENWVKEIESLYYSLYSLSRNRELLNNGKGNG